MRKVLLDYDELKVVLPLVFYQLVQVLTAAGVGFPVGLLALVQFSSTSKVLLSDVFSSR